MPEPVVIFCPCCCSAVDAWSTDKLFACGTCGQQWDMSIDVARIAAHSPA